MTAGSGGCGQTEWTWYQWCDLAEVSPDAPLSYVLEKLRERGFIRPGGVEVAVRRAWDWEEGENR